MILRAAAARCGHLHLHFQRFWTDFTGVISAPFLQLEAGCRRSTLNQTAVPWIQPSSLLTMRCATAKPGGVLQVSAPLLAVVALLPATLEVDLVSRQGGSMAVVSAVLDYAAAVAPEGSRLRFEV